MTGNRVSLEQKERWMRERYAAPSSLPQPAFSEHHYSVAEVADLWNVSQDFARRLFQDEPGVIVFGDQGSSGKRKYVTLRIPESVLQRVHRRLTKV